ncbi:MULTISPECIES: saccharopine dehydrogenase C-terminal domain-containing protein [unclassified Iodidimonas]|jgi:saccharopine dehydrogenase-like NADP-dependent oxidoreductase|uniref:saccharopine dehydrogenase C-terminal domain-containing protein n=1 Tax=unclassified Iodidimonas TaxID=2626145 RepID=UPI00248306CD|nr:MULTISPECIES: saccharopine dehydrogenase C-terminal domain-containing protein [unclassified Iodidimonas]
MKQILLLGAGKIGEMIATMLAESGDYQVRVADRDAAALARILPSGRITTQCVDCTDPKDLAAAMAGCFAVMSAMPYHLNPLIGEVAKQSGCHYLDLTEDVASTRAIKALAEGAATAFIPQCGLAPGFISIVAHDLARRFDSLHSVQMRVGALPKYPTNALQYNLTWSTDGLINEYCNPCEAVVNGAMREVPPLEEIEHFSLDGVNYEAFNTSGGLGTLAETLAGKVQYLNYRTVRYPGHRDLVKMLLQDLRLAENQGLLKQIFEHAIPVTMQDVVLIFVTVSGQRDGRFMQESHAQKIYAHALGGRVWSGIQITTAAGICAVLDLLAQGKIAQKGFVKQEDIGLDQFLANRFGCHYALDQPNVADAHAGAAVA